METVSLEYLPGISVCPFCGSFAAVTSGNITGIGACVVVKGVGVSPSQSHLLWLEPPGFPAPCHHGQGFQVLGKREDRWKDPIQPPEQLHPHSSQLFTWPWQWYLCWGFWGAVCDRGRKSIMTAILEGIGFVPGSFGGAWYFCCRSRIEAQVKLVRDTAYSIFRLLDLTLYYHSRVRSAL